MSSSDGRARDASERLDDLRGARMPLLHAAALSLLLWPRIVSGKFEFFARE